MKVKQACNLAWLAIPFITVAFALKVNAYNYHPDAFDYEAMESIEVDETYITGGATVDENVSENTFKVLASK